MKKLFVLLLCMMALLVVVSCNESPKQEVTPEPEPEPTSFVVTFNSQGGSEVASVTVDKGAVVARPDDPAKEGFIFKGWFTESTCENEYNFETPVTQAITLYAKWFEPEPAPEPIKQPGVLDVRPAEGVVWTTSNWEQQGKFQFKLDVEFNAGEAIALYLKCSDAFETVAVRQAGGDNIKFKVNGSETQVIANLEKTEDGWCIVTIPAESVTPKNSGNAQTNWIGLGITFYGPSGSNMTTLPCWAAIRGLKLGDDYFDITEWDEDDCVQSFYKSPNEFKITLTLDEE